MTPLDGDSFRIRVDLDQPLPAEYVGKVGFNLELFPGDLFGKSWLLDDVTGIFPRQADGPMTPDADGEAIAAPLARGKTLVVAPESDSQRLTIHSQTGDLTLIDGRGNLNNAWFIVRELIPADATSNAIEWTVTPNVIHGWKYKPVIQAESARLPLAAAQEARYRTGSHWILPCRSVHLYRLTSGGKVEVKTGAPENWGRFLRYAYLTWDFSDVTSTRHVSDRLSETR